MGALREIDLPAHVLCHGNGAVGARFGTPAASDALGVPDHDDRRLFPRLGVCAPPASQRAALQEYRGPYARTVVDAEALGVKDQALHRLLPGSWRPIDIPGWNDVARA